ncbi:MAG TPA: tetraacyldisaccharide 4'-kinase, partial [Terracidiphilus sp.]
MTASETARRMLLPLTPLYRLGLALRESRLRSGREPVRRLRFPVISIGNLSTGGAGKTPFAIALARTLTEAGFAVDVLSRGFGRQANFPARVRPDGTAAEFGDEPLLIARESGVPVYVASQRYQAGLLAESDAPLDPRQLVNLPGNLQPQKEAVIPKDDAIQNDAVIQKNAVIQNEAVIQNDAVILSEGRGATAVEGPAFRAIDRRPQRPLLHILDDAFQHRQLYRDIDILLLNPDDWHDRLLPAGNLREPRRAAMRASVIAIPATDPALETELRTWGWQGPIWRLHRRMEVPPVNDPVVAFCGIARPGQFFAGLEAGGLRIAGRFAFRDHHPYAARDLDRLQAAARAAGAAALVTTAKDEVRLAPLLAALPPDLPLLTSRLRIEIEEESAALEWLVTMLNSIPPRPPL